MSRASTLSAAAAVVALLSAARAAELVLPQERNAFSAAEAIEVAVSGATGPVEVRLVPQFAGAEPFVFTCPPEALAAVLPPRALAPGVYTVELDGADTKTRLTISSGLRSSEMLLSQTVGWQQLKAGGANFLVGNSFSWGRLGPDGQPAAEPRGRRSAGWNAFERAVAEDLPTVCYMYWTGYVTHKPFGSHKSWASADMTEALRLLNFSNAQQMRRFAANIVKVGTLDEPGLAWGRTPAGGSASGFPAWDEQPWYEARGWTFTPDIGNQADADFLRYMTIRCEIMKEQNAQAKRDLKTVWPDLVFATDLYALHAIMDGTEGMNQEINDIPTSHVFADWGIGRTGMYSGILLEKCDDPTRPFAHAMNGQLFEPKVGQPNQTDAYRACLNAMLMAGLYSNWWLNTGGMDAPDLASVNEPGTRLGSLFRQFDNRAHDIAVVWSFTELAMRQKDIARREAAKKSGEQIKLMVASMPETHGDGGIVVNAYSVGQDYKDQVLATHMALARAGYPAHILHERRLPERLPRYKTLLLVGQTQEFPAPVRAAIAAFQAAGGKVVVDRQTTLRIEGAIVHDGDLADLGFKWGDAFRKASAKPHAYADDREATRHLTNWFMDEPQRVAAPKLKAALQQTASRPVIVTDSVHLLAERHTGGAAALYMVLNAHDRLPEIPAQQRHVLYNYAPLEATFTLQDVPAGAQVWAIEGPDWRQVRLLDNPAAPIQGRFAPGEMKLYLVAPAAPGPLDAAVTLAGGTVRVKATLGLDVPWPVTVSLVDPAGTVVRSVQRALDAHGAYTEELPLGTNVVPAGWRVRIESPIALAPVELPLAAAPAATPVAPRFVTTPARVFDAAAIRAFLAARPELVIALGNDAQRAAAEKLATLLRAKGLTVNVLPEAEVLAKVAYPRVLNPWVRLYQAGGEPKEPAGEVKHTVTLATAADGGVTATDADGKAVSGWRQQPFTLVTVAGEGWFDWSGDLESAYEPGVRLYIDEKKNLAPLNATMTEVKSDAAFKARWCRPWTRLSSYVGGYQLPAQLPQAWTTPHHLVVLGHSGSGLAMRTLQASEIFPQIVDTKYPGPGRALVQFAWSPFAVERHVIAIGAMDEAGLEAGSAALAQLLP